MRPQDLGLCVDVSRETLERLKEYEALLKKWNPVINLVGRSTLNDVWTRHIQDSAQIWSLSKPTERWVDLGSGGGLPGLVIAIIAKELRCNQETVLIESDQRKAAFLRTVSAHLDLNTKVIGERIESVTPQQADTISARALAPLTDLFDLSQRHLADGGMLIFPKGRSADEEISAARETWDFDVVKTPSITDKSASILAITGLTKRHDE